MNYLTEIKAFYDWMGSNPLPASAIALWHALMSIANGANWPIEVTPTISTLQSRSGLGKDAICGARNKLKQCGLIDWKSRGGKQSATYRLISIVSVKPTQEPSQEPTQQATQEATQDTSQEATIYKLNETKRNEIKKTPISPFDELEEPLRSAMEEFAKMRKSIKAPLTPGAIKLTLNSLEKYAPGDDAKKVLIIEQSIQRGWRGVFPLKEEKQAREPDSGIPFVN